MNAPQTEQEQRVPMITLSAVNKVYGQKQGGVPALTGVSLSVHAGEFLAIVGPSGCGKSTLLQIVAGLVPPTHGQVSIGGAPVTGPRSDVGLMFQSPVLLPWRTVLQNVLLPAVVKGLDRQAYSERAQTLLRWVGLAGFENHYPLQLSGGMRQRAALVRALLLEPDIVLMDEPFSALDAMTRETMQMELAQLWAERQTTVIFSTHQISEAVFLADRVAIMSPRPGRIYGELPIPLPRPRTAALLGSASFAALCQHVREVLTNGQIPAVPSVDEKNGVHGTSDRSEPVSAMGTGRSKIRCL